MSCGIYLIKNIVTGDCYVGQSSNIENRTAGHRKMLYDNVHSNKHLQSSFNKYGDANFIFAKLEECKRDKKILCSREQYWMDKLKPAFNKAPSAGSTLGVKLTKKTKSRISKAMKGRKITWAKKISAAKKGVKHSTEAQLRADKLQSSLRKGKVGPTKGMKLPNVSKAMIKIWNERKSK